jgi:tRNA nucleotidyltransferase (CCA-adding enzyme)
MLSPSTAVRFDVLTHDLGKGETPPELWPRHSGHGERSAHMIEELCRRLPVPRKFEALAIDVARHHGLVHRAAELRASTMLDLLVHVDALRQPQRLDAFLLACEADARGRGGLEERPYPQGDLVRTAQAAALGVNAVAVQDGSLEGPALGAAIRRARIAAVARALAAQAERPP